MIKSEISSGMFGLVLLFFLLPWFNVSCGNEKIMKISGTQLIGVTKIENISSGKKKRECEPLAIIIFLFGITGLISGLILSGKSGRVTSLASGGLGFIFLILLSSKLSNQAFKKTEGLIKVNQDFGYWLVLLTLIGTVILNVAAILTDKDIVNPSRQSYDLPNRSPGQFCTECGVNNSSDNKFCENCGTQL